MAFTYFFRDPETLALIVKHALPDLSTRCYINIWDAGCAHGPEPYSLAITLRENMGRFLFRNVRIYATDLDENDTFGGIIARGCYNEAETRRIPADILARYFDPQPEGFQVKAEIRQTVRYQRHDLLSLQPIREELGLIVCKNVLLHLSPADRIAIIHMFHAALAEGGYLVTEPTQKLPPEVEPFFHPLTEVGQLWQKVTASVPQLC